MKNNFFLESWKTNCPANDIGGSFCLVDHSVHVNEALNVCAYPLASDTQLSKKWVYSKQNQHVNTEAGQAHAK